MKCASCTMDLAGILSKVKELGVKWSEATNLINLLMDKEKEAREREAAILKEPAELDRQKRLEELEMKREEAKLQKASLRAEAAALQKETDEREAAQRERTAELQTRKTRIHSSVACLWNRTLAWQGFCCCASLL